MARSDQKMSRLNIYEDSYADRTPVDVVVPVSRFEQQKAIYCGPACCQMLCDKYDITIVQRDAFDKIQLLEIEPNAWYSDPRGLSGYLTSALTSAPISFSDNAFDDQQAALDKLFYTLNFLQVPCVVLVLEGNHWVVVDGLRLMESADGQRTLVGVFVQDPWFNQPNDRYVAIKDFTDTYILPAKWGAVWRGKYVVISNAENRRLLQIQVGSPTVLGGGVGPGVEGTALANLEEHGFENIRPIQQGGGAPVLTSLQVQYLDREGYYFLVPLDASRNDRFQDYIYAAIEGVEEGKLLEVASLSHLLDVFNDVEAMRHLAAIFPHDAISVDPAYYWKGCLELRSRFQIARRFLRNGVEGFLLPNGTVVDTLHDPAKGGG